MERQDSRRGAAASVFTLLCICSVVGFPLDGRLLHRCWKISHWNLHFTWNTKSGGRMIWEMTPKKGCLTWIANCFLISRHLKISLLGQFVAQTSNIVPWLPLPVLGPTVLSSNRGQDFHSTSNGQAWWGTFLSHSQHNILEQIEKLKIKKTILTSLPGPTMITRYPAVGPPQYTGNGHQRQRLYHQSNGPANFQYNV